MEAGWREFGYLRNEIGSPEEGVSRCLTPPGQLSRYGNSSPHDPLRQRVERETSDASAANILRPSTSHQLAWHDAHLPFGNEIAEPAGVGELGHPRTVSIHDEDLEGAVAVAMKREMRPLGDHLGNPSKTPALW